MPISPPYTLSEILHRCRSLYDDSAAKTFKVEPAHLTKAYVMRYIESMFCCEQRSGEMCGDRPALEVFDYVFNLRTGQAIKKIETPEELRWRLIVASRFIEGGLYEIALREHFGIEAGETPRDEELYPLRDLLLWAPFLRNPDRESAGDLFREVGSYFTVALIAILNGEEADAEKYTKGIHRMADMANLLRKFERDKDGVEKIIKRGRGTPPSPEYGRAKRFLQAARVVVDFSLENKRDPCKGEISEKVNQEIENKKVGKQMSPPHFSAMFKEFGLQHLLRNKARSKGGSWAGPRGGA